MREVACLGFLEDALRDEHTDGAVRPVLVQSCLPCQVLEGNVALGGYQGEKLKVQGELERGELVAGHEVVAIELGWALDEE